MKSFIAKVIEENPKRGLKNDEIKEIIKTLKKYYKKSEIEEIYKTSGILGLYFNYKFQTTYSFKY